MLWCVWCVWLCCVLCSDACCVVCCFSSTIALLCCVFPNCFPKHHNVALCQLCNVARRRRLLHGAHVPYRLCAAYCPKQGLLDVTICLKQGLLEITLCPKQGLKVTLCHKEGQGCCVVLRQELYPVLCCVVVSAKFSRVRCNFFITLYICIIS